MKSIKNRLCDMEANLTSRQLVLLYATEMNTFQSLEDWLLHQYKPKILAETGKRREALYDGLKRGVNAKDPDAVRQACRKASREFGYLFTLTTWPSLYLDRERYRHLYSISYLIQSVVSRFKAIFLRGKQEGCSPATEDEKRVKLLVFRERLKKVWIELKGLERCEQRIAARFFEGKPLFFESDREFLTGQFDVLSKLNYLLEDMRSEFCYEVDKGNLAHTKTVLSLRSFYESLPLNAEELEKDSDVEALSLMEKAKSEAEIYVYSQEDRMDDVAKSFQGLWGIS